MGSLGWPELLILLVVVLLIFGTTRLAGLGKAGGRAIREFKEETRGLNDKDAQATQPNVQTQPPVPPQQSQPAPQPPQQLSPGQQQPYQGQVYDAEVVDPDNHNQH